MKETYLEFFDEIQGIALDEDNLDLAIDKQYYQENLSEQLQRINRYYDNKKKLEEKEINQIYELE